MTSPPKSLQVAQPEQVDLFITLMREISAVHERVMAESSQMIAKHLKISVKMRNQESLKFFNAYGSQTAKMWHAFKDEARSIVSNPLESEAILKAVLDTLTCLSDWMEAS